MAAIQLKEDVVLSWFRVIVKATRRIRRESDQVCDDGTFFDLRVMRCEPVENDVFGYYLTRGDRHVGDHLSHERTCRLVINGHARDATTLRGLAVRAADDKRQQEIERQQQAAVVLQSVV